MKLQVDSFRNGGSISIDGVRVGRMEHYPDMTYLLLVCPDASTKFIARCKYGRHGIKAKAMARWIFKRFSYAELVAMDDCWEGACKAYNEYEKTTPEYHARLTAFLRRYPTPPTPHDIQTKVAI